MLRDLRFVVRTSVLTTNLRKIGDISVHNASLVVRIELPRGIVRPDLGKIAKLH